MPPRWYVLRRVRPAWLALAVFFGSFAAVPPARAHAGADVDETARQAAVAAVDTFLEGLRARSAARLGNAVAFPFVFDSTNAEKRCERDVADQRGLALLVRCLKEHEPLLLRALAVPDAVGRPVVVPRDRVSSADLRAAADRHARGDAIVRAVVSGPATFELVFLVQIRAGRALVVAFLCDADALV